ncbi:hypothetical protein EJ110_NYTH47582 [Nymphaea thermarum]|nr:hypothetical protein EJ110_NYTH47582 [Nymphaea thermarum]
MEFCEEYLYYLGVSTKSTIGSSEEGDSSLKSFILEILVNQADAIASAFLEDRRRKKTGLRSHFFSLMWKRAQ